jgi:hypothetical protein
MEIADAEDALRRGEVLGAELNPDFRVMAITVGPVPGGGGEWPVDTDDPRLQLLLFPVGEFAASLRRGTRGSVEILQFEATQFPEIIALFDRSTVVVDPWVDGRPNRGEWGPRLSLQGNSAAPDGRRRHVWLALEDDDLRLDLHATFDEIRVLDAAGTDLL